MVDVAILNFVKYSQGRGVGVSGCQGIKLYLSRSGNAVAEKYKQYGYQGSDLAAGAGVGVALALGAGTVRTGAGG